MGFRSNVEYSRNWIADAVFFTNIDLPGEEWREFKKYGDRTIDDSYMISNKGRIRNSKGEILKGTITFDGYHEVLLGDLSVRVHRAVLSVFKGLPPKNMEDPTVQHINHSKLDNRIENLCWMSAFDNNQEGHGVRCKIIDKDGEHIFPSQKFASKYIGRHDDYISEGIGSNYKMTTAQGESFEVYTEVDGEWVKYKRRMPNNRRWCRLVRDKKTIDFESFQQCSKFLNLSVETVGNCVFNGWPLPIDQNTKFYIYNRDQEDYLLYVPVNQKHRGSRRCVIIDARGTHEFTSISKAAVYIGKDPEWLRLCIRDNKTIKNCDGAIVQAQCIDPER